MTFEEWLYEYVKNDLEYEVDVATAIHMKNAWEAAQRECKDIVKRAHELAASEAGKNYMNGKKFTYIENRVDELEYELEQRGFTSVRDQTNNEIRDMRDNLSHIDRLEKRVAELEGGRRNEHEV